MNMKQLLTTQKGKMANGGNLFVKYEPIPIPIKEDLVNIFESKPIENKIVEEEEEDTKVYTPTFQTAGVGSGLSFIKQFKHTEQINDESHSTKTTQPTKSKNEFVNTMVDVYTKELKGQGMDNQIAEEYAKRLTAQDALESNWGRSLAGKFNYGGIKGKGNSVNTTEFINGEYVKIKDSFRNFDSISDYAKFKINLLNRRYDVFKHSPENFATQVKQGGYATDPNYINKLNNLYSQVDKLI